MSTLGYPKNLFSAPVTLVIAQLTDHKVGMEKSFAQAPLWSLDKHVCVVQITDVMFQETDLMGVVGIWRFISTDDFS